MPSLQYENPNDTIALLFKALRKQTLETLPGSYLSNGRGVDGRGRSVKTKYA